MQRRRFRFSSSFNLAAPQERVHEVLVDLELELTAVSRATDVLEVEIDGPIHGWARYHLGEQSPGVTELRCEQEVYAVSRTMLVASYVARPLLVWNHGRMMRGLETGIRARLGERSRTGS